MAEAQIGLLLKPAVTSIITTPGNTRSVYLIVYSFFHSYLSENIYCFTISDVRNLMGKCSLERTVTKGSERTEPACFGNWGCPQTLLFILSITTRTKRSEPFFLIFFFKLLFYLCWYWICDPSITVISFCYIDSRFCRVIVGLRCLCFDLLFNALCSSKNDLIFWLIKFWVRISYDC